MMEVDEEADGHGVDEEADDEYEYVTRACQRSPATAVDTVHLRLAFYDGDAVDDGRTVFRVSAVVVGEQSDIGGVYRGAVTRDEAAAASRRPGDGAEPVRLWLRDARAALTGRRDDGVAAEYVHCLQRAADGEGLLLTWKQKLRPLGTATLGAVRLSCVAPAATRLSDLFLGPLIRDLSAERARRRLADRAASENERRLLDDNRHLLDQIRSMADIRQRDDQRLMARFLEILNAKKMRLSELELELSQLKEQQQGDRPASIAETKKQEFLTTTNRRRGSARCTGRGRGSAACCKTKLNTIVDINQLDNNVGAIKKQRTIDCSRFDAPNNQKTIAYSEDPANGPNQCINVNSFDVTITSKIIEDNFDVVKSQRISDVNADDADNRRMVDNSNSEVYKQEMIDDSVDAPNNQIMVAGNIFDADTQIDDDLLVDENVNVVNNQSTSDNNDGISCYRGMVDNSVCEVNNQEIIDASVDAPNNQIMVAGNVFDVDTQIGDNVDVVKNQSTSDNNTDISGYRGMVDNNVCEVNNQAMIDASVDVLNNQIMIAGNNFNTDTQIDDNLLGDDASPPWFQFNSQSTNPKSSLPSQSSQNKDCSHQRQNNNSVLDNLWQGIL